MTELTKLRKSIQIKFKPTQKESLNSYFKEYAKIVNYSINFAYNVYMLYERTPKKEGVCTICDETTTLTHKHKRTNSPLCNKCFRKSYSEYTLRPSLIPLLKQEYPDFSIYLTSYYSTLRHTFGTFKSWVRKQEERLKERKQIKEEFRNTIKTKEADFTVCWRPGLKGNQEELQIDWHNLKRMHRLEKDIRLPYFNGTTIRLWKGFSGIKENYDIWIKHPKIEKEKIEHKSRTGKYQTKHIDEMSNKLSNKYMSIHKKGDKFFLDMPYTKKVKLMNDEEILKESMKSNTTLCYITFGIKEPAMIVVYQNNKQIETKKFGDSTLYDKKQYFKILDKKVMTKISKRHKPDKSKITKQKNKWWKKTRNKRADFVRDYDNRLTYNIAKHISKFSNPVVIMRNNSYIKRIEYKGKLKNRLMMWSVAQEQKMLEHKLNFMGISVYWFPYKEINELTCPKCGNILGKILTYKLKFNKSTMINCRKCNSENNLYIMDINNIMQKFHFYISNT